MPKTSFLDRMRVVLAQAILPKQTATGAPGFEVAGIDTTARLYDVRRTLFPGRVLSAELDELDEVERLLEIIVALDEGESEEAIQEARLIARATKEHAVRRRPSIGRGFKRTMVGFHAI